MATPPTAAVDSVLARDTYGKSRVRLMKLVRRTDRHDLKEITLEILFQGDFASCYESGDNSKVLPTDTIKNTVYVLARKHEIASIEEFSQRLIEHFLTNNPQVSEVRVDVTEHLWSRITPTAFTRESGKRTALVTGTRDGVRVEAGIGDLLILRSAGSAFEGYIGFFKRRCLPDGDTNRTNWISTRSGKGSARRCSTHSQPMKAARCSTRSMPSASR
jgi:urate oxidase